MTSHVKIPSCKSRGSARASKTTWKRWFRITTLWRKCINEYKDNEAQYKICTLFRVIIRTAIVLSPTTSPVKRESFTGQLQTMVHKLDVNTPKRWKELYEDEIATLEEDKWDEDTMGLKDRIQCVSEKKYYRSSYATPRTCVGASVVANAGPYATVVQSTSSGLYWLCDYPPCTP